MSRKAAGPWWNCPCGVQHPRGCHGHVEECTNPDCLWRGDNRLDAPCHKCAGRVARRPCRRPPRIGTTVCDSHGAAAPQHDTAIERRADVAKAIAAAGQLTELLDGIPSPAHLADGMLDRVAWLGRMATAFGMLCGALDLHPAARAEVVGDGYNAGGDTGIRWITENKALYGPRHDGDGAPHVLVDLARTWTVDYLKAAKLYLDAGIDERRLQLEAAEIDQLQAAVMKGLSAAELDADQQTRFTAAFVEAIRELSP